MKRKLISIIALIFAANLCFSAVFNDKTFEEVFTEDIEEALEYLEGDKEALEKDFYPQNTVAKEFIQSLPTEFTASPMLNPVQDENGDYQIAYTLLIETKDFLASVITCTRRKTDYIAQRSCTSIWMKKIYTCMLLISLMLYLVLTISSCITTERWNQDYLRKG